MSFVAKILLMSVSGWIIEKPVGERFLVLSNGVLGVGTGYSPLADRRFVVLEEVYRHAKRRIIDAEIDLPESFTG